MNFKADGTIVVTFPRRRPVTAEDGTVTWEASDETEDVTLRRPVLEELFEMWEAVDRLSDAPVKGSDEVAEVGADIPAIRTAVVNLRRNALWIRTAIDALGNPKVYSANEDGALVLREDLSEPAWFSSATAAGQMLRHWQEVPLAPGGGLTAVR